MKRLLRSVGLFFEGMGIFYGCAGAWWLKVIATPAILVLCALVAVLNLADDDAPWHGTDPEVDR